ncbi:MAG TPA: protein kinase [Polyangia bacterium]|nr:protein kinase [Polyangia bacterium]
MPPIIKPPAGADPPGLKKLGRYEFTEQLGGEGGFETYRARVKGLTGLDRSFAVKVLRLKRSETPSAVSEPFLQAARRSATLADPHIAKVVEADSGDGLVFAVTPFLEGADLGQFLQRAREAGALATGKDEAAQRWHRLVAYIGAEIARGLQAVHAQQPPVIHGSLSPGNVFIASRGTVRLLDLGLRASVRRPFEPRPRRLLPYIAPELAAPAADCTAAGDMYSLGVLLCELSSGELPPQGRRASELQIALSSLPEDLGLLLSRLVSASPAARPKAADVISSLAAVYAGTAQAVLAGDLSSLIQRSSTNSATAKEPPEAVVSWAATPEEINYAPPPPSDVEHDDAYGFEAPLHQRAQGPAKPAAGSQPAVASVRAAAPADDLYSSHDLTAVGEPALMDDLVARSRPAPSGNIARIRPESPRVPGPAAAPPAIVPVPVPASIPARRGPTRRGFGPTGTAAMETAPASGDPFPQGSSVATEDWLLRPPSGPSALLTPSNAAPANPFSPLAPASPTRDAEPFSMQDAGEMLPKAAVFEAQPATWGARALAALGGQAGIASSTGSPATGLGLLDEVQAEPSQSYPLAGSPSLGLQADPGNHLRRSRPFALDEAEASPLEVELGTGSRASGEEPLAANFEPRRRVGQPRGDALLEDELVDSPDGIRSTSPYGLLDQAPRAGQPLPEPDTLVESQSPSLAEAVAFAEDEPPAAAEAAAYLDDGALPVAAPAMVDDRGQSLPESELSALPEAAAPQARRSLPRAPEPPPASSVATKRRAQQQAPVPAWAQSPDEKTPRHGNRRLVWTIAASVLGASVVAGGLAGFFVGARGKPWSAILGGRRQPALSAAQAVPSLPPALPDDVEPQASPPSGSEAEAKPSGTGTRRVVPAVAETPSPAKKARAEKLSTPPTPDKKIVAAAAVPAATWNKGVADGAGTGGLATLSVTSQPVGALVWINGKERGRTPLQVKLQSGPAHVVLVLAGHASATVDVTAGEGTQVSKELLAVAPPLTGDARFRAECTTQGKLPIVVDGKETGVLCPFSKLRVDPGVHKIGLFVPALGQVHEKEVTLHSGVRSIVFAD